jgi:hypothetical protein
VLCVDSREGFQRTSGAQGMGSILDKAQANRERDQDGFACVSSKRSKTGAMERRAMRGKRREIEAAVALQFAAKLP